MSRRMKAQHLHTLLAAVLTLVFTAWLFLKIIPGPRGISLLASWLLSLNAVTFCYYGYDKWRAKVGSNRVPEVVLHGLALLGGSLGAYLGMRMFRHKTIKGTFQKVFWVSVGLQLALVLFVVYWFWIR